MKDEQDICRGCPLCRPREQNDAGGACAGCSVCSEVELAPNVSLTVNGQGKASIEVAVRGDRE